jgi:peptide/nickel transport system substrate-binding protein
LQRFKNVTGAPTSTGAKEANPLSEKSRFVRSRGATGSRGRGRLWLHTAGMTGLVVIALGLTAAATARSEASKPVLTYNLNACGDGVGQAANKRYQVYPTLVHASTDASNPEAVKPGLATSWKIFPGNKVIQFKLRHDIRFSDGTVMDAKAVKAALNFNIYGPGANAFWTLLLGPVRSITALDKWTVRVTFKTPSPILPFAFAFVGEGIVGPKYIATLTAKPNSTAYATTTDGPGPYMVDHKETVIGTRCVFIPNPYYPDKAAQPWSKIVELNITDPNAALAAMKTGQIAATNGDAATADAAKAAGFDVSTGGVRAFYGLTFLDRAGKFNPALADVRVRRALNYAVDRKTIVSALFGKYATPTSQAMSGTDGSDPKLVNAYPYDPAKAKSLLAAAGYAKGFKLKVVSAGTWLDSVKGGDLVQAICKYFAAVNVTCDISATSTYPEYATDMQSETASNFEAGICPCGSPITSYNYTWFINAPGLQAEHGWRDPVSDKLWQKLIRADAKTAAGIQKQLVARWTDQAYLVPVVSSGSMMYTNPKVLKGAKGTNNWGGFWNANPAEWAPAK